MCVGDIQKQNPGCLEKGKKQCNEFPEGAERRGCLAGPRKMDKAGLALRERWGEYYMHSSSFQTLDP